MEWICEYGMWGRVERSRWVFGGYFKVRGVYISFRRKFGSSFLVLFLDSFTFRVIEEFLGVEVFVNIYGGTCFLEALCEVDCAVVIGRGIGFSGI